MKISFFQIMLFTMAIMLLSCENNKVDKVDMPPSLASQLEDFGQNPSETKADSLVSAYQDMADTESLKDAQIADWFKSLADSLDKQEYWTLSSQARIQAIRYNASGPLAPEHLINLAQQLHIKEGRLPISKAAYQSIVEYYPASEQVKEAEKNLPEDQPSLRKQIQDLEDQLMQQTRDSLKINHRAARDYVTAIQLLAAIDKDNEAVPGLLNRAAAMAKGLGENRQAIDLYNWVMKEYPDTESSKKALFYKGFTLDENLNNDAEAEKIYNKYLEKYPNDPMTSQVKILKEQLGKSNEEILNALQNSGQ